MDQLFIGPVSLLGSKNLLMDKLRESLDLDRKYDFDDGNNSISRIVRSPHGCNQICHIIRMSPCYRPMKPPYGKKHGYHTWWALPWHLPIGHKKTNCRAQHEQNSLFFQKPSSCLSLARPSMTLKSMTRDVFSLDRHVITIIWHTRELMASDPSVGSLVYVLVRLSMD